MLTSFIRDHGVYAVFVLMVAAAIVPAASELTMLYAGAVAAGAFGAHVALFGTRVSTAAWAFVTMAVAGVLGNALGAVLGWSLGACGGRPFLERYGRALHVTEVRIGRAERWFARFGSAAVPLGLATPVVRSFVALPAGMFGMRLRQFAPLAVVGCLPFCFGLAGVGWALGRSYGQAHSVFRYVDVAVVAAVVVLVVALVVRRRRSSTIPRRASDPAG